MNRSTLDLPARSAKPRTSGITMMIDGGLPLNYFRDVIEGAAEYIDFVKFGWGTAVVSHTIDQKIEILRDHDVRYYFGGTLFEKHVLQNRFDDFRTFCSSFGCSHVEVSNGTIDMSNAEKAGYIHKLAGSFEVISEVGFKDADRSARLTPDRWIECVHEDLDAGAHLVTLESRESGRSGICRPDGKLRVELVEELLTCGLSPAHLLFEAPSAALQGTFIRRIGPDANLGNVAAADVIGLETLRLGLRADTLHAFEHLAS
jgi:phosphosulfolactate synthase